MRGEVYELPAPRNAKGHEQRGKRYAVAVQNSALSLSTWLVCPTSTSAQPASFRPEIEILETKTLILADQLSAVDFTRLGRRVGYLSYAEMAQLDAALKLVLDLP